MELREAGVKADIVLLGGFREGEEEEIVNYGLIPFVFGREMAERLSRRAKASGRKVRIHLKVDTGMGRLGVLPEEVKEVVVGILGLPCVELEGIASHLSTADEGDGYLREQIRRFLQVKAIVDGLGLRVKYHLANSAALFSLPEAHFDMVRPGIALYGVHPSRAFRERFFLPLKPVMTWKTKIIEVRRVPAGWGISYGCTFVTGRPSRIAALAVGYADGYPRSLSNKAQVLIRGRRAAVVGRVTMDWTLIDVTDMPDVGVGDEVVLFGEGLGAEELASWAGTIPYEILCLAGKRSKRVIKDG
ncbi:MAG: alanine racemase [Deltaproteobacteria bacterium]|nr:MAG: alanine racemase [Deltaproteobacteria bacterium]